MRRRPIKHRGSIKQRVAKWHDKENKRVAQKKLISKQKSIKRQEIQEKQVIQVKKELDELQQKAKTSRTIKRKVATAQSRSTLQYYLRIKKQFEKQNGTFIPKQQLTLDQMRQQDKTIQAHETDANVQEELIQAETLDELKRYFTLDVDPKIYLTVQYGSRKRVIQFAQDLVNVFGSTMELHLPKSESSTREVAIQLAEQGYTSLIVIQPDNSYHNPAHMLLVALPYGPSAYFQLTNVYTHDDLIGSAEPLMDTAPEVILTNFKTRLGRRVGRLLQQTLSKKEILEGRQVVTFHNQRDFIFFRAYCYKFKLSDEFLQNMEQNETQNHKDNSKIIMKEIGPEFTLRLRWLQTGIYNPQYEEFEFVQQPNVESSNRKLFFL